MNNRNAAISAGVTVPIRIEDDIVLSTFYAFEGLGRDDFAVKVGDGVDGDIPIVRVHSECVTGDVFASARCDCGPQLQDSLRIIRRSGYGFVIYLRQEGRGIGLNAKLRAYEHQDSGLDTFEANARLGYGSDLRTYEAAGAMLHALNITSITLLTNNPDKILQLRACGIDVAHVKATGVFLTEHNLRYLTAKKTKAHHALDFEVRDDAH